MIANIKKCKLLQTTIGPTPRKTVSQTIHDDVVRECLYIYAIKNMTNEFISIAWLSLGVPITQDIRHRSRRPSIDDVFPYFYDNRTTEDQRAMMVEFMECCMTKIKYSLSNKDRIEEGMVSSFFCYVERFHLFNEFS